MGHEGIPGLLLGSYPDEVKIGGKAWEGLGSSRLEGYVHTLFLRLPADFDRWYQGKRVSEQENMIRGGLKYKWATGISAPRTVEPKAPSTSA